MSAHLTSNARPLRTSCSAGCPGTPVVCLGGHSRTSWDPRRCRLRSARDTATEQRSGCSKCLNKWPRLDSMTGVLSYRIAGELISLSCLQSVNNNTETTTATTATTAATTTTTITTSTTTTTTTSTTTTTTTKMTCHDMMVLTRCCSQHTTELSRSMLLTWGSWTFGG